MTTEWSSESTDVVPLGGASLRVGAERAIPAGVRAAAVVMPDVIRDAGRTERFAKRAIDYLGAGLGSLLISPLLLVVALLVKLDSKGPVLFKQARIGKDGRPFTFYKFRSMETGCDSAIHREHVTRLILGAVGDEARSSDGSFKLECDPRVTRVGKFLRRSSIDELPQLINVLKGEMSLVGPRPPLPYEVEVYSPRHMRRLEVLPGITGLWQVSGRTRLSFEEMVDLDIAYVDSWSLALDMRILAKTVSAVVGREGAG